MVLSYQRNQVSSLFIGYHCNNVLPVAVEVIDLTLDSDDDTEDETTMSNNEKTFSSDRCVSCVCVLCVCLVCVSKMVVRL